MLCFDKLVAFFAYSLSGGIVFAWFVYLYESGMSMIEAAFFAWFCGIVSAIVCLPAIGVVAVALSCLTRAGVFLIWGRSSR